MGLVQSQTLLLESMNWTQRTVTVPTIKGFQCSPFAKIIAQEVCKYDYVCCNKIILRLNILVNFPVVAGGFALLGVASLASAAPASLSILPAVGGVTALLGIGGGIGLI